MTTTAATSTSAPIDVMDFVIDRFSPTAIADEIDGIPPRMAEWLGRFDGVTVTARHNLLVCCTDDDALVLTLLTPNGVTIETITVAAPDGNLHPASALATDAVYTAWMTL